MKKILFLFIYFAISAAAMFVLIRNASRNRTKFPLTGADYDGLAEKALRPIDEIKEIYGKVSLLLQHDAIFDGDSPIVRIDDDDYLLPFHEVFEDFDVDGAIEGIRRLNDFCNELDIPFFYVSFPSKGTYGDVKASDYGYSSNEKQLRDNFLKRIRDANVPMLNLDKNFKNKGFTPSEVFYRTDHHWTTRMGLIAAHEIALYLQRNISRPVIAELLEEDRFRTTVYENKWLGETGRKVSATWSGGLEDYVLYEPDYETAFDYFVPAQRISDERTFSDFIDKDFLDSDLDLYHESLHYAYLKDSAGVTHFRNKNLPYGARILLIKDSYSMSMAPFLAITCGELFWWDMRETSNNVTSYIDKHRFDAVVLAYTDFWRDIMYDFQ